MAFIACTVEHRHPYIIPLLAMEHPTSNIQVVTPGMVDTPMVAAEYDSDTQRLFGPMRADDMVRTALASCGLIVQIPALLLRCFGFSSLLRCDCGCQGCYHKPKLPPLQNDHCLE
jgi:hypothetical protein